MQIFRNIIVLGGLNVDLNKVMIPRIQRVADLLAEYRLIDLVPLFHQRHRFRNLKTWSQVWQETVLRSRCNYIIKTDRHLFKLVGIQ